MYKTIFKYLTRKIEYTLISLLIFFTITFTSFYNQKQKIFEKNVNDLINNVYLEKTVNNIFIFSTKYVQIISYA